MNTIHLYIFCFVMIILMIISTNISLTYSYKLFGKVKLWKWQYGIYCINWSDNNGSWPPPLPLTSLRLKWNFRKCVLLSGRVPLLKFVFIKMKNMRLKGSVDAKIYYIISWVTWKVTQIWRGQAFFTHTLIQRWLLFWSNIIHK